MANLAPQRPGVTDVYTIGIAGWAEQDVFIKELNGGLDLLAHHLPTENRVLRLVNHPDTVLQMPIASRQNFAAAVRAVARVMDRDEDVLLLFVTSHGGPWGVALQLWGLAHSELSPEDVATVLDEVGIKNRILIVSACYSGVFAKPLLADENSIILTAADESHSSFGCSNEREWTYFGDALFNRGLTQGRDLEHAFTVARDVDRGVGSARQPHAVKSAGAFRRSTDAADRSPLSPRCRDWDAGVVLGRRGEVIIRASREQFHSNSDDCFSPVVPAKTGIHYPFCCDRATTSPHLRAHGVWVPAFAGTT